MIKKKLENLFSKEKVQKILFVGLIVLVFGVFLFSLILSDNGNQENNPDDNGIQDNNNDKDKDDKNNDDKGNNQNVEEPKEKYTAPIKEENASVFRQFYSLEDDEATQEMSLIQYGNKYFMSKGITYRNENNQDFEVIASLSGTVEKVEESSVYGNTIIIDHGDGVKTEYVGVKDVKVSVGSNVKQGDVIATSGTAEYDVAAGNHVHFKVSINNKYYDPMTLFGKEK